MYLTRRTIITGLALVGVVPSVAGTQVSRTLRVTKDPSCGCCGAWVDHMRAAGFQVEVTESSKVNQLKARLGVPAELASCHTAEIDGYVLEGHVPPGAVHRLLAERPSGRGLAVPGMPVGSPGMEVAGIEPDKYEVVLFGPGGHQVFARYEGARAL